MQDGSVEISLQGIGKVFGNHVALANVNLDIYSNELHVFLGPSGCGKTTLLRMIAGFETPDEGAILHKGRRVSAPGADRGFIFQEGTHFPWRTVIKNIEFGLECRGIPKEERHATATGYLKLVGLERFADYYPSKLSGGMKQKMVLATCLANNPDVLLMDEPFGALDAQTRTYMQLELLRIWSESRKMIVFVTHSIVEALLIGSRVSVFKTGPGRIFKCFDLDELLGAKNVNRSTTERNLVELESEIYAMMRQDAF
jgi:NitT/TauT family transport system ATP-binding protein